MCPQLSHSACRKPGWSLPFASGTALGAAFATSVALAAGRPEVSPQAVDVVDNAALSSTAAMIFVHRQMLVSPAPRAAAAQEHAHGSE